MYLNPQLDYCSAIWEAAAITLVGQLVRDHTEVCSQTVLGKCRLTSYQSPFYYWLGPIKY